MKRVLVAFALTAALLSHAPGARAAAAPCGGPELTFDASDDASEDAAPPSCPANDYCAYPDGGAILDGGAGTCAVQSCGGGDDAATCALIAYCALSDGGAILDGAAGLCALEPCIASSECPNGEICDTSQNPFQCLGCISGSDCSGDQICDTTTHTCVEPPPPVDAGPDASSEDASADASLDGAPSIDAALPPADATVDAAPSNGDASVTPLPDSGSSSGGAGGSLAGGACDCDLSAPRDASLATLGLPFGLALLFAVRRRARRARR